MNKDDKRRLFLLGVDRHNRYGRDAYTLNHPLSDNVFAKQAHLAGVRCAERNTSYSHELREVLQCK